MLKVALIVIAVTIAAGLLLYALCSIAAEHCDDSPDGEHEYMHTRTEDGWCLTCSSCGRMTAGVDGFHRRNVLR